MTPTEIQAYKPDISTPSLTKNVQYIHEPVQRDPEELKVYNTPEMSIGTLIDGIFKKILVEEVKRKKQKKPTIITPIGLTQIQGKNRVPMPDFLTHIGRLGEEGLSTLHYEGINISAAEAVLEILNKVEKNGDIIEEVITNPTFLVRPEAKKSFVLMEEDADFQKLYTEQGFEKINEFIGYIIDTGAITIHNTEIRIDDIVKAMQDGTMEQFNSMNIPEYWWTFLAQSKSLRSYFTKEGRVNATPTSIFDGMFITRKPGEGSRQEYISDVVARTCALMQHGDHFGRLHLLSPQNFTPETVATFKEFRNLVRSGEIGITVFDTKASVSYNTEFDYDKYMQTEINNVLALDTFFSNLDETYNPNFPKHLDVKKRSEYEDSKRLLNTPITFGILNIPFQVVDTKSNEPPFFGLLPAQYFADINPQKRMRGSKSALSSIHNITREGIAYNPDEVVHFDGPEIPSYYSTSDEELITYLGLYMYKGIADRIKKEKLLKEKNIPTSFIFIED